MEKKYLKELQDCNVETDESCERSRRTNTRNKYVNTISREDCAVRLEVVQSAINFLEQRTNIEEDTINFKNTLDAKPATELITASRDLVSQIFGPYDVGQCVEDVCQSWAKISNLNATSSVGPFPGNFASGANLRVALFGNVSERRRACLIKCRKSGICVENRESKKIPLKYRPSV